MIFQCSKVWQKEKLAKIEQISFFNQMYQCIVGVIGITEIYI